MGLNNECGILRLPHLMGSKQLWQAHVSCKPHTPCQAESHLSKASRITSSHSCWFEVDITCRTLSLIKHGPPPEGESNLRWEWNLEGAGRVVPRLGHDGTGRDPFAAQKRLNLNRVWVSWSNQRVSHTPPYHHNHSTFYHSPPEPTYQSGRRRSLRLTRACHWDCDSD